VQNQVKRNCSVCGGTGAADSGGVYEWGETIYLPCECFFERNDKMENETFESMADAVRLHGQTDRKQEVEGSS
jgi:hypothetical protein